MQYKIDDLIYKSETAARSHHQRQSDLVKLLSNLEEVDTILDYGCGKLRYFEDLSKISKNLILTDSDSQLSRKQTVFGKVRSVCDFVLDQKNATTVKLKEIENYQNQIDFVLLSNVLSSVPLEEERVKILKNIEALLKPNGQTLIVVQYKDSYFKTYSKKRGVKKLNSGYLFESRGQVRYYALLDRKEVEKLVTKTSLLIDNIIDKKGRLFVFLKKNDSCL